MNNKLDPNYGYAILKPEDEGTSTYGNIIVPDTGKEKGRIGTIESIEKIYNFNTDQFIESKFKPGDRVMYPPMGGQTIKVDNEEYIVISISDLLTAIRK